MEVSFLKGVSVWKSICEEIEMFSFPAFLFIFIKLIGLFGFKRFFSSLDLSLAALLYRFLPSGSLSLGTTVVICKAGRVERAESGVNKCFL
jgi:hypothetical protein